jgi:flavorubredoxin
MSSPRQLKPNIYSVGAVDRERRVFDALIPLPDGTSYNAYLIKASEKTVLLDTVDPNFSQVLLDNLSALNSTQIDYVVAHHAEQDHSGTLPLIIERYPKAKILCTPKCKEFLLDLFPTLKPGQFQTVADRESVSLGDRTLEFIYTPWVHWPETMVSCVKEDQLLFSCDFFGAHLATSDLFVVDVAKVYDDAKRYYAEIMMPFRGTIKKHLELLDTIPIQMIAPSHGPVYNKPQFIMSAYKEWVSDKVKNNVVIAYVSMHGSTHAMVNCLEQSLIEKGITVKGFELSQIDLGRLAMELVDAATVVIAAPTVLTGAHPLAAYVAYLTNALRPKTRFMAIIGSHSWASRMVEDLSGLLKNVKAEILPPVLIKGHPKPADYEALEQLAQQISEKHSSIG